MMIKHLEVYTDDWAKAHHSSYSTKLHTDYIVKLVKQLPVKTILDVGCASGHLVNALNQEGYKATGIDIVESNIYYARSHSKGYFICGSTEYLKMLGWKVDLIILSHVLEHLEAPTEYLLSITNLLHDGGYIIITTPNTNSYSDHSMWRQNRCYVIWDKTHVQQFIPTTLSTTLQNAGYRVDEVNTHTYRGNILGGLISTVCRIVITGKAPNQTDVSLVSKKLGNRLESLYASIPSGVFDRMSERNNKGSDIVVIARKV